MFDIGFSELLVVGVLGLIVLGPERLPKAARTVGLLIGKARRAMSGIQQEIEQEVRNQEIRERLNNPQHIFMDDAELAAQKAQYEHGEHGHHEPETETEHPQQANSIAPAGEDTTDISSQILKQQLDAQKIAEQKQRDAEIAAMHAHHPKLDNNETK